MTDTYQSPYADFNSSKRFNLANQLAKDYRLDVSQILFTYLKVAQPILSKQQDTKQIPVAAQRKIDQRFEKTLKSLSQSKG
ncbi:hypothetical protein [Secundilactobacillus folii]|uniref:Uncharacterized protein n=1 Tax=Secundilactobacillus folii TaxID=2678357 RepID=A0A7X2XW01_9LACO|nr:hypothetical protein [Secundilactobacillus folii]MTV82090.1 hypothetical protein [Secundilactobacillus folii]